VVDGEVRRKRALRGAPREDGDHLALGAEVRAGDSALERLELVVHGPAERVEAAQARTKYLRFSSGLSHRF